MDVLLDTCAFLWWAMDDPQVPGDIRRALEDPANQVHLSAASGWEIAVKHALGRLVLARAPTEFVPEARDRLQILSLPITEVDALHVSKLPRLHRDPFDRILVAQALVRGWPVATPDPAIQAYPCRILWG